MPKLLRGRLSAIDFSVGLISVEEIHKLMALLGCVMRRVIRSGRAAHLIVRKWATCSYK